MANPQKPTITITVSGPTGSGKSRVLGLICSALALSFGGCHIDAQELQAEMNMNGGDFLKSQRPQRGTTFKLAEQNQPLQTKATAEASSQATNGQQTTSRHEAINRGDLANQLIALMEPHCQKFNEEKVIEAAVLALFTVMHPAHAAREIREIIGS